MTKNITKMTRYTTREKGERQEGDSRSNRRRLDLYTKNRQMIKWKDWIDEAKETYMVLWGIEFDRDPKSTKKSLDERIANNFRKAINQCSPIDRMELDMKAELMATTKKLKSDSVNRIDEAEAKALFFEKENAKLKWMIDVYERYAQHNNREQQSS